MFEIRLLFGRPAIMDRDQLISAIRDVSAGCGCIVQALNADLVVSERHIRFAAEKALEALSQGRNIAKDAGMEIMRYASGERQIERAFFMGVGTDTERIVLVLAAKKGCMRFPDEAELSRLVEPDENGCRFSAPAVMKGFNISPEELSLVGEQRIEDLVIERVALADTYR